jgi:hypothetical protein
MSLLSEMARPFVDVIRFMAKRPPALTSSRVFLVPNYNMDRDFPRF